MKIRRACDHCSKPLGEAAMVVHHPSGVSGIFCVDDCYLNAVAAKRAQQSALETPRLHADVETLMRGTK